MAFSLVLASSILHHTQAEVEPIASLTAQGIPSFYQEKGLKLPHITFNNQVYAPSNGTYKLAYTAPGPIVAAPSKCLTCPSAFSVHCASVTHGECTLMAFDLITHKQAWNVSIGPSLHMAQSQLSTSPDGNLVAVALYKNADDPALISVCDGKSGAEFFQLELPPNCKWSDDESTSCSIELGSFLLGKYLLVTVRYSKNLARYLNLYEFASGKIIFFRSGQSVTHVASDPYLYVDDWAKPFFEYTDMRTNSTTKLPKDSWVKNIQIEIPQHSLFALRSHGPTVQNDTSFFTKWNMEKHVWGPTVATIPASATAVGMLDPFVCVTTSKSLYVANVENNSSVKLNYSHNTSMISDCWFFTVNLVAVRGQTPQGLITEIYSLAQ